MNTSRTLIWASAACLSAILAISSPAMAYKRPVEMVRVDVAAPGGSDEGTSGSRSVTTDGRFVAFETDAPLASSDSNDLVDIYLRDLKNQKTQLISQSSTGESALPSPTALKYVSTNPAITPNGRFIAFDSEAPNLVAGDTNAFRDAFVLNTKSLEVERVSVDSSGMQSIGPSSRPTLSDNGRYVSFTSAAPTLVENDKNEGPDIFVHDRRDGTTVRVSVDSNGNEVDTCRELVEGVYLNPTCLIFGGDIRWSSINASGRYVAFDSRAPNLVDGDNNNTWDVFVHDLTTKKTERISVASDGQEALTFGNTSPDWGGSTMSGYVSSPPVGKAISADGRYVTFASLSNDLIPNDTNVYAGPYNGGLDIFVKDRQTGRIERVSVTSYGRQWHDTPSHDGGGGIFSPNISSDGRFVAFDCGCYSDPDKQTGDFFYGGVYDRHSGALLEMDPGSPSLSPSGRFVSSPMPGPLAEGLDNAGMLTIRHWLLDVGDTLGIEPLGDPQGSDEDPPDGSICIQTVCIRPGGVVSAADATDDLNETLTRSGANLYGASVAYRPHYEDLFAAIELDRMPKVVPGGPVSYGLRFQVDDRNYEVRATSRLGGEFGLFECTLSSACTKIAELRGGYGTTGMRVVFSLPLATIGLSDGGEVSEVMAFSALGTRSLGASTLLDELALNTDN